MTGTGEEPDYRFTLANERTFLAWLRTALALLAAGVAVVQLVPEFGIPAARQVLGVALTALSVLAAVTSVRRWQRVERAMRHREALPPSPVAGDPRRGPGRGRGGHARARGRPGVAVSSPPSSAGDIGLQPQRTAFAWNRTSLALLGNAALLLHRDVADSRFVLPAGLALIVAAAVLGIGQHRRMMLRRRPLPAPLALRWQIPLLGWSMAAMALLTGVLIVVPI